MNHLTDDEKNYLRQCGRAVASGVFDEVAKVAAWVFLVVPLFNILFVHDDCDANFWHHCGASVVVDAKTGVQYLTAPGGGIVRREKTP